jgi:hypothetical protein
MSDDKDYATFPAEQADYIYRCEEIGRVLYPEVNDGEK